MGATMFAPPPHDPSKSSIESLLELTPVLDIGPGVFTNTRPLWHPPGARGIYGGAAIAQCLAAAQLTVPDNFLPHSMHCYFVLSGDSALPILYHVERVRDGKSFATRTVQARQRGRPIFTTTLSFDREGSGGVHTVEHATPMDERYSVPEGIDTGRGPFESRKLDIEQDPATPPHERRVLQYIKARGKVSEEGGLRAHLAALAYMSDSYFIGTVSRVQNIPRRVLKDAASVLKNTPASEQKQVTSYLTQLAEKEAREMKTSKGTQSQNGEDPQSPKRALGMMVSLDHTIYFHNPRHIKVDEWIFTEMTSPWAGSGRGMVHQKMWASDGTLIASCVQEGVVRLKQDEPEIESKL